MNQISTAVLKIESILFKSCVFTSGKSVWSLSKPVLPLSVAQDCERAGEALFV